MKKILNIVPIVIIGIILNITGRYIANKFNLPIWMDMTGTIIASYYGGLWSGIIAGMFNNIIYTFFDHTALIYSITNIFSAVIIHYFIKKGYVDNLLKTIISSFWLGVFCTLISTPLNIIFYDGYSGNSWGDTLVDMLKWYDIPLIPAALAGEAIVEIVDKQIAVLLACLIVLAVAQVKKIKIKPIQPMSLLLIFVMISTFAIPSIDVSAEENILSSDNFVEEIYNNTNGMVSSEANVICETNDGYIWIGSYAGLSKYNGTEFEFVREGGLVNVVDMMTDSKGRLWIGTNDAGIARYENGTYTYFTKDDGLPANSIRCFAEDTNGNVYVGTSGKICKFSTDDNIEILSHDITFVTSMTVYNNLLLAIDNNGSIHALNQEKTLNIENSENEDYFYYCLANTSRGLLVGTEQGEIFSAKINSGKILLTKQTNISVNQISSIFEDSKNRIWIASGSGFGYIGQDGEYHEMSYEGFDTSIKYFHEDYQGNIWIASSSYGVMKLSESAFINAFDKIGTQEQVVNAVIWYKGYYFCGTDKGLVVFDQSSLSHEFDELVTMTDGCRVRSLFIDSKDGLWICTYSGLIYYSSDGSIRRYNVENDAVTSDRFRCITELSDGTIAAGTADGINFIKDGNVIGTLSSADGLDNTQILSIVVSDDDTILAGSDGSGIYVISDGKLIGNYTVDNGLSSNVVLRIIPCEDRFLVVTSNALCCIDQNGEAKRLKSFPYFNNYDIIIRDETAYITCSAGLYEIALLDLFADNCQQYMLYNADEGLFSGLTANSWNYVSDDGLLYLCSNNGVIVFNKDVESKGSNLKFGIISVECDETFFEMADENTFIVPGDVRNLSVHASVQNYGFSDVKVRFFVKELDDNPKTYKWNEIEPIRIFKPDSSEYTICLQLLDSSYNVLQEKIYTVKTESRAWEKPLFKTYLIVVCFEVLLLALISIVSMIFFIIRKNELEKLRSELELKITEQTGKLITSEKTIKDLFIQTVTALSEAVDAKDRYTSGHSKRVAEYARMIAARMGKDADEQEEIYQAGLLHDIGKIRIPFDIINKDSKLTDEEYNIIKLHPVTGYHILRGISGNKLIAVAAKYHHERYDGKGYPNGLEAEQIPEVARILGVADSYDAMASNRSYREALPQDVVRSEFVKCRGTQFDPYIADIMLQLIDEDKDYTMKQIDSLQRKILTVDDEQMNNKIIARIMRDEPMYEIVSACSGKEALEILEQQTFDLILLDVKMPDMDGFETFRAIREKYDTPIAFMTSDKELEVSKEFIELGCDDYITKPFFPAVLKEIVHNMTERTNIE